MSNSRRAAVANSYRADFLRSPAWFARRARWFRKQAQLGNSLMCSGCGEVGSASSLELHHLDYAGVSHVDGRWRAFERDDDLVPLHPTCHELLHRLIDRDTVLSRQRSRRDATLIGLEKLRAVLTRMERSDDR